MTPPPPDGAELAAVRRIRAISWYWRPAAALRRPRLLAGLLRRQYGVAAQDVERELGALVPGIVGCSAGARCPRHARGAGPCTGYLTVDYARLAGVLDRAARQAGRLGAPAPGTPAPLRGRALRRYCHDRVAALQSSLSAAAAARRPPGSGA